MIPNMASHTAAAVAAFRGLAGWLEPDARLVHDPYGLRFVGDWAAQLGPRLERVRWLRERASALPICNRALLYMQLRTRAIDETVERFVEAGGRQIVLLGAGFDCRAARLELPPDVTFFEVDHPATQAKKRRVLERLARPNLRVQYLARDFERDTMAELPAALAERGHTAAMPTLTIWEGVTMYLTEPAIEATFAAVHAFSSPGSRIVFTYITKAALRQRSLLSSAVILAGEPFRFGWDPERLPAWLAQRGFTLLADRNMNELARELLPARIAHSVRDPAHHIAQAGT